MTLDPVIAPCTSSYSCLKRDILDYARCRISTLSAMMTTALSLVTIRSSLIFLWSIIDFLSVEFGIGFSMTLDYWSKRDGSEKTY